LPANLPSFLAGSGSQASSPAPLAIFLAVSLAFALTLGSDAALRIANLIIFLNIL